MQLPLDSFSFGDAVPYHNGAFPPAQLDYARLAPAISKAAAAIARYDAMLRNLHNKDLLLAPLRRQEAVISSRIEGTVATIDEVLQFEAEEDDDMSSSHRQEVAEVYSYSRALSHAQSLINNGLPISSRLIREAHSKLLFYGRGADKQPGHFKTDQNYIVDKNKKRVLFVPIDPTSLQDGIARLENFVHADAVEPLTQTALAHVEFEALHPFKDGNGRVGRMLITLILWDKGLISAPHFYISGFLEKTREEYIDRMRLVSSDQMWTEWCLFFLNALEQQANENIQTADRISGLYESMKDVFRETLASQWSITALDFIFSKPVFRGSAFTANSGIPRQSAARYARMLAEARLLTVLAPASGRRPALYAFEPLLNLVRV